MVPLEARGAGVGSDHEPDIHGRVEGGGGLSDEDRATLAGLLIESLEGEPDPGVEAAWAAEIEKRVAELDAGTVESIPWEQVRQRLLDRLNAR